MGKGGKRYMYIRDRKRYSLSRKRTVKARTRRSQQKATLLSELLAAARTEEREVQS